MYFEIQQEENSLVGINVLFFLLIWLTCDLTSYKSFIVMISRDAPSITEN